MSNRIYITILLTVMSYLSFAQNDEDGYWDKDRASVKEISLAAKGRTWRKIDLPIGTTEVAFRITVLDKNQKMIDSFVDALSEFPSASAKVAATGISLLSKIAGDDKCRYFIFSDYENANLYLDSYSTTNSCYLNPNPINRDVVFLKSNCLSKNPENIYFAFHNTNSFLRERIILEVVPWVNKEASRGWTLEIKKTIYDYLEKTISSSPEVTKPKEISFCILDKLQKQYKVQDFQSMTEVEINNAFVKLAEKCSDETGENDGRLDILRQEAQKAYENNDLAGGINRYLHIVNSGEATVADYNELGWYYLTSKQYPKAIKYLKLGEKLDNLELAIKSNLAHAYLLTGDVNAAKKIYIKYKGQNINESVSWNDAIKADFALLKSKKITSPHFNSISNLLK